MDFKQVKLYKSSDLFSLESMINGFCQQTTDVLNIKVSAFYSQVNTSSNFPHGYTEYIAQITYLIKQQ